MNDIWSYKIVDEIYIFEGFLNNNNNKNQSREGYGILRNSID